jgi:hypothetical protein
MDGIRTGGHVMTGSHSILEPGYTILEPGSVVEGRSVAEWTQEWWTWVLQSPADANPVEDPTGAFANQNNDGPVFFIAGTPLGEPGSAVREFEVPAGTPLLIPMVNFFDTLDPEEIEEQLVAEFRESVVDAFASIDGKAVPDPLSHYEETGFFSLGEFRPGTVIAELAASAGLEIPPGTPLYPTKAAGYWLVIEGLDPGDHTLHFGGSTSDGLSTEVTDLIHVVREDARDHDDGFDFRQDDGHGETDGTPHPGGDWFA